MIQCKKAISLVRRLIGLNVSRVLVIIHEMNYHRPVSLLDGWAHRVDSDRPRELSQVSRKSLFNINHSEEVFHGHRNSFSQRETSGFLNGLVQ